MIVLGVGSTMNDIHALTFSHFSNGQAKQRIDQEGLPRICPHDAHIRYHDPTIETLNYQNYI